MSDHILRIAIIGCGAVTELGHLPATSRQAGAEAADLVHKNRSRAEALSRQYGVPHVAEDYTSGRLLAMARQSQLRQYGNNGTGRT